MNEQEQELFHKAFADGYEAGYYRACRKILEDDVRQRPRTFEVEKIDEFICNMLKQQEERSKNEKV